MNKILAIHGPNLNLLGQREQHIYGCVTLQQVNQRLEAIASANGAEIECVQSNSEGVLIDTIQSARDGVDFIIINPAGLTHTSVCLRDALLASGKPFIEVHISNIHAREQFRSNSYLSDIAVGVITGLGTLGYEYALQSALTFLNQQLEASETWQ